jgi:hypothetical protein
VFNEPNFSFRIDKVYFVQNNLVGIANLLLGFIDNPWVFLVLKPCDNVLGIYVDTIGAK